MDVTAMLGGEELFSSSLLHQQSNYHYIPLE